MVLKMHIKVSSLFFRGRGEVRNPLEYIAQCYRGAVGRVEKETVLSCVIRVDTVHVSVCVAASH